MGVPKPAAPIAEPAPSLQGREEVKLMYDMMTAAFQTDSTRVFSYRLPVETMVKSLGLRLSAQDISQYSPGERMEASRKRDPAYSELMAGLLVHHSEVKRYLLGRARLLRPALGMKRVSDDGVQCLWGADFA